MHKPQRWLAAALFCAMVVAAPWAAYHAIRAGWSTGTVIAGLTAVSLAVVYVARRLVSRSTARPHDDADRVV